MITLVYTLQTGEVKSLHLAKLYRWWTDEAILTIQTYLLKERERERCTPGVRHTRNAACFFFTTATRIKTTTTTSKWNNQIGYSGCGPTWIPHSTHPGSVLPRHRLLMRRDIKEETKPAVPFLSQVVQHQMLMRRGMLRITYLISYTPNNGFILEDNGRRKRETAGRKESMAPDHVRNCWIPVAVCLFPLRAIHFV